MPPRLAGRLSNMAMTDDDWRSEHTSALFGAILRLETPLEAERFFRDLCTLGELRDLAQRWAVVRMLDAGLHYAEISKRTGASTATITRIASWLRHGEGGYQSMLARIRSAGSPDSPAAGPGAAAGLERS
jgi:TrpR-related protein YerC/YecD